ncbi:agrin-like [Ctenocephalides felis]|uniref:agrin-like n=1 Tax=Ctenocephalides felis TaxID=7515 RepID=UPI000E6E4AAD|nr:agrin-like [Ctenocephalides felis]
MDPYTTTWGALGNFTIEPHVSAPVMIMDRSEPYIPRPQIIETPCERKHCAHNADCIEVPTEVDPSGAICECVTNCPDYDNKQHNDERVCGSDNRVYPSRCHLRMASCKNRLELYVKHEGECDSHSPCVDHHCSQIGSHCILDANNRPKCECVQYCSPKVFKDDWICGDDGVDYRNICELQKASCLAKTTITALYNGTCDPCAHMTCPHGTICVLDQQTRQAKCDCGPEICYKRFARSPLGDKRNYYQESSEVCASDHKTYANECEMKRQSCREQRQNNTLKVVYKGHCETGVHPCSIHTCASSQHRCELEPQTGTPQCVCGPSHCPKVYTPLCVKSEHTIDKSLMKNINGNDRVFTMDSYCNLAKLECKHGRRLEVLHEGKCGK